MHRTHSPETSVDTHFASYTTDHLPPSQLSVKHSAAVTAASLAFQCNLNGRTSLALDRCSHLAEFTSSSPLDPESNPRRDEEYIPVLKDTINNQKIAASAFTEMFSPKHSTVHALAEAQRLNEVRPQQNSSYKKIKRSKSLMVVRAPAKLKIPKENHTVRARASDSFLRGGTEFMPQSMRKEKELKDIKKRRSIFFASAPSRERDTIKGDNGSVKNKKRTFSTSLLKGVKKMFGGEKVGMPPQQVTANREHFICYDSPSELLPPEDGYQHRPVEAPSFRYRPSIEFDSSTSGYGSIREVARAGSHYGTLGRYGNLDSEDLTNSKVTGASNPWTTSSLRNKKSSVWSSLRSKRSIANMGGTTQSESCGWSTIKTGIPDDLKSDLAAIDEDTASNHDGITDAPERRNTLKRSSAHSKVFASLLRRVGRRGSTPVLNHDAESKPDLQFEEETDHLEKPVRRSFSLTYKLSSATIRKVTPPIQTTLSPESPPLSQTSAPDIPPPPVPHSVNVVNENFKPIKVPASNTPRTPRTATFFPSGNSGRNSATPSPFKRALAEFTKRNQNQEASPSIYSRTTGGRSVSPSQKRPESYYDSPPSTKPLYNRRTALVERQLFFKNAFNPMKPQNDVDENPDDTTLKMRIAKRKGSIGNALTETISTRMNELRRASIDQRAGNIAENLRREVEERFGPVNVNKASPSESGSSRWGSIRSNSGWADSFSRRRGSVRSGSVSFL